MSSLTSAEKKRELVCSGCGKRWVPRVLRPYHTCNECGEVVARPPRVVERFFSGNQAPRDVSGAGRTELFPQIEFSERQEVLFSDKKYQVMYAIDLLNKLDEPCFIQAISDYIGAYHGEVRRVVVQLEEADIVTRKYIDRGTKRQQITPTAEGRIILSRISSAIDCIDVAFLTQ